MWYKYRLTENEEFIHVKDEEISKVMCGYGYILIDKKFTDKLKNATKYVCEFHNIERNMSDTHFIVNYSIIHENECMVGSFLQGNITLGEFMKCINMNFEETQQYMIRLIDTYKVDFKVDAHYISLCRDMEFSDYEITNEFNICDGDVSELLDNMTQISTKLGQYGDRQILYKDSEGNYYVEYEGVLQGNSIEYLFGFKYVKISEHEAKETFNIN